MTRSERLRLVTWLIVLALLIGAALFLNRFQRQGGASADILGTIANQAVAIYQSDDGTSESVLSDISTLTVASGSSTATINYKLEGRQDLTIAGVLQLFRAEADSPLLTLKNLKASNGSLIKKLANLPNGSYDFTFKPNCFISQTLTNVPFNNGQGTKVSFTTPFLYGDLNGNDGDRGDNVINSLDYAVLLQLFNSEVASCVDANTDLVINTLDLSALLANFGVSGQRYSLDAVNALDTTAPTL
ncbi:MAG: hypothetical protein CEO22_37 [Candidatus Berkelbacteria bacterium Gr01-1014_85]|uniref:Dockerin domain-containing protein n=1 Tax=Candidatus Berkelbacteria bacterium Gr01-1014_85 TaxID=2017150 RepID=A0A554JE27_9BACT|nr:MAG: hypothetical protein CEO22_37 [Candidatus Berkelbacteria bacterium Gr01-1014_85]